MWFNPKPYLEVQIDPDTGQRIPICDHPPKKDSGRALYAFMETIEVTGFNDLPRVLRIDPYGVLPDSSPSRLMIDEYNFR